MDRACARRRTAGGPSSGPSAGNGPRTGAGRRYAPGPLDARRQLVTGLLIRDAEVPGVPGVDVRIQGDRVAEIGPGLTPMTTAVLHAGGGAVLPGLHDHHV